MMKLNFNYRSVRSKKARLNDFINKYAVMLLFAFSLLLVVLGLYIIVTGSDIGYVVFSVAVYPVMIITWKKFELIKLRPSTTPMSIDDLISVDVLGRIPETCSPSKLAEIISQSSGGRFFAFRFGISPSFLVGVSSSDPNDMATVWEESYKLYNSIKAKEITSAIILVALLKAAPSHVAPLNHLQLDVSDLESGVRWYHYLLDLSDNFSKRGRTGGLARDWSFGWTPILDRFALNISTGVSRHGHFAVKLESHSDIADRMIDIFSKKGRQNVVLVGQDGIGKSEIIKAFAARIMDGSYVISNDLKYRQVYMLDAASLVSLSKGEGIESIFSRIVNEAYVAKNIILCLDNAHLFFEDGIGSADISNVLMPLIDSGVMRLVLAMNEQQLLKIQSRTPDFSSKLNIIKVEPADEDQILMIMQHKVIVLENQNRVLYMHQALKEAYRLASRYIYDLSMPGKVINLLEYSAQYAKSGIVSSESVRQAIEEKIGIRIGLASNDEREKLLNLESELHKSVVGQDAAVSAISSALKRARSGIANQNRPIGTFMFLGPTGVGKTELAKTLSRIYFNRDDALIRVDMNEFSGPDDGSRLIQDGAANASSLTSMVMKKPFSVVLFDEIEKANPNTILMLLQMLDEGVLRDVNNREVSFKDTIIIATSNAGAERIREYIERGYEISRFEEDFVNDLINSRIFKPEFINRFDDMIIFKPLNKNELISVVDIMIAEINKTLSVQKISINLDFDARNLLVEKGYDPRLGARPIRRIIQKTVENIIANKLLSGEVVSGDTVSIDSQQISKYLS